MAIVGAGLAGALLAVLLGRRGYRVSLFERRADPRTGGAERGRSINLALSTRGIHALEQAGLAGRVLQQAIPMYGRMIHGLAGQPAFQPYAPRRDQAIHSVSRADLNATLVEAAEALGIPVAFGRRCVAVDPVRGEVTVADFGGKRQSVGADFIVGADGAYSEVRRHLVRSEHFDYQQSYLEHGYKELTIPAGPGGRHLLAPNALHIWPRGGFMMIALPNRDGSFTATCFWPLAGPNSFDALGDGDELRAHFARVYPDALPLLPDLERDYFANPTGSLVTIRCRPWHRERAVLIGDACHAVVPFYGQGANAAFEDCVVLADILAERPADLRPAFAEYERRRKEHTDALADLALHNFVEMRDRTASAAFRWGKKLEHGLARALPSWFVPLYSMVTFSRTPHADAVRRARRQWRVVGGAAAGAAALGAVAAWLALRRRR
ncbi:MAG: FAD-dependent monooxygenase [Acidobacteria bacterium]|nr:FAD-dependent monooxygenase [Acidobacteriota bacterium]